MWSIILYMTRVQRERFFNEEDYLRLKDSYILTPEKLAGAKADLSFSCRFSTRTPSMMMLTVMLGST